MCPHCQSALAWDKKKPIARDAAGASPVRAPDDDWTRQQVTIDPSRVDRAIAASKHDR
jgi:hypothetical protein